jgi:annexin A7/11
MTGPISTSWRARLLFTGATAALAVAALASLAPPAQARVWVGVGGPCCGYYEPDPYYGYYAPPPGYYPPPPGYYPPAPAAYPPPPGASPSAYTPDQAAPGYAPPAAGAAPAMPSAAAAAGAGGITYTNKPAFTNAAGQTCRQYKTTDMTGGHPVDVFGTACREADGQWRVAN